MPLWCVPTWPSGRLGLGLQPQPAWGGSARLREFVSLTETARGVKTVICSDGNAGKPVDGAV